MLVGVQWLCRMPRGGFWMPPDAVARSSEGPPRIFIECIVRDAVRYPDRRLLHRVVGQVEVARCHLNPAVTEQSATNRPHGLVERQGLGSEGVLCIVSCASQRTCLRDR